MARWVEAIRATFTSHSKAIVKILVSVGIVAGFLLISHLWSPAQALAAAPANDRLSSQSGTIVALGVPAISVSALSGPIAISTPRFSGAAAMDYVSHHGFPHSMGAVAVPVPVSAVFLTTDQVTTLLGGEYVGVPSDTLLCFVKVKGQFEAPGPSGSTVKFTSGYEVFDAHTGNLLMAGALA